MTGELRSDSGMEKPGIGVRKEFKLRLLLLSLVLLTALAGCAGATPTPRPTPTTASPQFKSNEVIGIVHNKMIQECGAKSALGTYRAAYSASPRSSSTLTFRDDLFTGIWDIRFDISRMEYHSEWPVLYWEFYEDSETVVQMPTLSPLWWSRLCTGG